MNKVIGLIVSLVLMITLLPLQRAEASPVNKHYTVNAGTKLISVREKPSPKAKVAGSLKNGTVVFVYNTEPGGWSKIKYNGKAGYVASSQLKDRSSGKISRNQAKQILIKTNKINTRIAGVRDLPEMDRTVNGVTYYCFDVYALTEGFAASSYFVSSKDGRVLDWSSF
ncbi:SH3 domain-containing protein [Bacillus sp. B190/17]|uniref:SH3 domain-containing protein n=1 Tax=Bacillus lumedeiriae TaxID=3058829 RepID=A0ABW8IC27_9BACI